MGTLRTVPEGETFPTAERVAGGGLEDRLAGVQGGGVVLPGGGASARKQRNCWLASGGGQAGVYIRRDHTGGTESEAPDTHSCVATYMQIIHRGRCRAGYRSRDGIKLYHQTECGSAA